MKKKELAVGDSTEVEIIFSTGRYSWRISKNASIICNAPGMLPMLSFTAVPIANPDSIKVLSVTPFGISLDSTRPERQKTAWEYDVSIKNTSNAPYRLRLVSAPTEFMRIDVPGSQIEPGNSETIKVKVDQNIADKIFNKSFTVEASDSASTRVTVPISKSGRWEQAPASPH